MRRSFEKISDSFPMEDGVKCERVNAGGVPSEWLTAAGPDPERAVIYLHGGGYDIGSVRTHRVLMAKLAKSSNARVGGWNTSSLQRSSFLPRWRPPWRPPLAVA